MPKTAGKFHNPSVDPVDDRFGGAGRVTRFAPDALGPLSAGA
jgi:hypothetical protein